MSLALFVWRMTQLRSHTPIGKYHHLANWHRNLPWKLPWKCTTVAVGRPDNKLNHCGTEKECEYEEIRIEKRFSISMEGDVFCKLLLLIYILCALDALVYGARRELKRSLSLVLAIFMTKFCLSKEIHFQHLDRARNVTNVIFCVGWHWTYN